MPDFRTPIGWVEAKGLGRDQVLKIKVDQWMDLIGYYDDAEYPVWVFVFDSSKKRSTLVKATIMRDLLNAGRCEHGLFASQNEPSKAWIGWRAKDLFS